MQGVAANHAWAIAERQIRPISSALRQLILICEAMIGTNKTLFDCLHTFISWINGFDYNAWNLSYQQKVAELITHAYEMVKNAQDTNRRVQIVVSTMVFLCYSQACHCVHEISLSSMT